MQTTVVENTKRREQRLVRVLTGQKFEAYCLSIEVLLFANSEIFISIHLDELQIQRFRYIRIVYRVVFLLLGSSERFGYTPGVNDIYL